MKFTYPPEARPLDGYTIKRAIYRGGFGEVYYAVSDAGREVALKLLQNNSEIELRGVQQCLNLSHPNLVTIFDVKQDKEGDHWILMEYVAGETLDAAIRRYPQGMPVETVRKWLPGLTAGVSFLHSRGIVHRDLKPANLFLDNGVVKIGDIGLSKFITPSRRSAQTQSVGTVYYMAPEIAKGRYGKEVDVYATGVILFEMLTGQVPFDGESTGEILMKHLTQQPDLRKLPPRLQTVIARSLHKDPEKRFRSLDELKVAFDNSVLGRAELDQDLEFLPPGVQVERHPKVADTVSKLTKAVDHDVNRQLDSPPAVSESWKPIILVALVLVGLVNPLAWIGVITFLAVDWSSKQKPRFSDAAKADPEMVSAGLAPSDLPHRPPHPHTAIHRIVMILMIVAGCLALVGIGGALGGEKEGIVVGGLAALVFGGAAFFRHQLKSAAAVAAAETPRSLRFPQLLPMTGAVWGFIVGNVVSKMELLDRPRPPEFFAVLIFTAIGLGIGCIAKKWRQRQISSLWAAPVVFGALAASIGAILVGDDMWHNDDEFLVPIVMGLGGAGLSFVIASVRNALAKNPAGPGNQKSRLALQLVAVPAVCGAAVAGMIFIGMGDSVWRGDNISAPIILGLGAAAAAFLVSLGWNTLSKNPDGLENWKNKVNAQLVSGPAPFPANSPSASLPVTMGSLALATPVTVALTAVLLAFLPKLFKIGPEIDPSLVGLFAGVSLLGTWGVTLVSHLFRSHGVRQRTSRWHFAIMGAGLGAAAWGLSNFLMLNEPFVESSLGRVYRHADRAMFEKLGDLPLYEYGVGPTLMGYIAFFTSMFLIRDWSHVITPFRRRRLSLWTVAWTVAAAWLATMVFPFEREWALAWATVIACGSQLANPIIEPRPQGSGLNNPPRA